MSHRFAPQASTLDLAGYGVVRLGCFLLIITAAPLCDSASAQLNDYLSTKDIQWQVRLDAAPSLLVELGETAIFTTGRNSNRPLFSVDNAGALHSLGAVRDASSFTRAEDRVFLYDPYAGDDARIYSTDGVSLNSVPSGELGYFEYDVVIPTDALPLGNRLFYRALGEDGWELHHTDGVAVTHFDINPRGDSFPLVEETVNGNLVFIAIGSSGQYEMFRTDGAAYSGLELGGQPLTIPRDVVAFKDQVYFTAETSAGRHLLRTDGVETTSLGEFLLDDEPLATSSALYFLGNPDTGATAKRLYSTQGTVITEYEFEAHNGATADLITTFKDEMYFRAAPIGSGMGFYRTAGTDTELVLKLADRGNMPQEGFTIEYEDELYFAAQIIDDEGTFTGALFKTDGSRLERIVTNNGAPEFHPRPIGVAGDSLFFSATGPGGLDLLRITGDETT